MLSRSHFPHTLVINRCPFLSSAEMILSKVIKNCIFQTKCIFQILIQIFLCPPFLRLVCEHLGYPFLTYHASFLWPVLFKIQCHKIKVALQLQDLMRPWSLLTAVPRKQVLKGSGFNPPNSHSCDIKTQLPGIPEFLQVWNDSIINWGEQCILGLRSQT